ncbi:MAG: SAM-dependent methyltransferase, partial [Gammaproteobacteria bacterium]|nr:SAM-dependent methyltransferase [Gammaproteobacteria bacterium]
LSIIQWHHFAYMIISIALLGYGASGAFITVFQQQLKRYFALIFFTSILLFAISSIIGFTLVQQLPFNPLELFWDNTQWIWLFILYFLLILPFFFAAISIGLALSQFRNQISACYASDLLGAAAGALGIVFLLQFFSPVTTLQLIVFITGLAGFVAVIELKLKKTSLVTCFMVMLMPWLLPNAWLVLKPSEYKSLSQTLNIIGSNVVNEKTSPLGVITVVESPVIPFRHAPGLSLNSNSIPPEQLGVFVDADNMSVINRFDGDLASISYLDHMTSALPYQLLIEPEVLILGAGGGSDLLQAKYFRAKHIDAVELNPQMVNLVKTDYAEFAGHIYSSKEVNLHIAEARAYIQSSDKQYDLIQMALMDSFSASVAGLHALNESYLYTTEAVKQYMDHLKPNGMLAITRWVKLPPRDTLKLIETAKQALQQSGVSKPEQHIALVRSWNTATLIVKNSFIDNIDKTNIINFAQQHSFDIAYYPGINKNEVNKFNILPEAYFYKGASALLSDDSLQYMRQYKYNLQAATDDRPYFLHFLKWRFVSEIVNLPANQGLALIEWGTVILVVTLLQAVMASAVLILLPLWIHKRKRGKVGQTRSNTFIFSYFSLLGIAFMFIEIAFIQRFILFLGNPTYAVAVVLASFLFFAGIGSAYSNNKLASQTIKKAILGIVVCTGLYLLILPGLFSWTTHFTESTKIIISVLLISPLAFFMGMPFPLGLSLLTRYSPAHIPWAWGVNGCASVISAIAATLVAIQFGFTWVLLLALVCYTIAGVLFLKKEKLFVYDN